MARRRSRRDVEVVDDAEAGVGEDLGEGASVGESCGW